MMKQRPRAWFFAFAIVLTTIVFPLPVVAQTAEDYFENKVRPLLIEKCLNCHSAQAGKTSGGLALDTRVGWQKGGDSGPAIVPNEVDKSLLVKAIRHEDGGPQMPPNDVGGKMTPEQIQILEEWIKSGAHDPREEIARLGGVSREEASKWWSFQPLKSSQPPDVPEPEWNLSPIDRFIRAEQVKLGFRPVSLADKETLIRRATYDLTGLPPTQNEIQNFLDDNSPEAFAKVVERLLQSPAYGERWGRHWLDVARYADTAGDGADYPVREAVLYRDWVIDAINRDMPFDQFIREQVAGDILANQNPSDDYASRVTATGFLAIGKRYGYAPNPDYQHLDIADAIDSVGRSILGLSLGCARCHDHKYEPVTMVDYYSWYGIFQSSTWSFPGGEEYKKPANFPPLVPPAEVTRLEEDRKSRLTQVENRLAELRTKKMQSDPTFVAGGVDLDFEKQELDKAPGGKWFAAGPNFIRTESQSPFQHVHRTGKLGVRVGSGLPNDGIRYVFEQAFNGNDNRKINFTIDFRTPTDADQNGSYRFYLGRGVLASQAIECSVSASEFAIKNGDAWEVVRKLEKGTWYSLQLELAFSSKRYAGSLFSPTDLTRFEDKQLNPAWDGVIDTFFCDGIGHVAGQVPVRDIDNLGMQYSPFLKPGETVPEQNNKKLTDEELKSLDAEIAQTVKDKEKVSQEVLYPVAYGISEGKPSNAKIQKRGEPEKLGDEVPRRNLELLGGESVQTPEKSSGRLDLANWLTSKDNPLTSRVFVNRVWNWHFGTGIVSTPSDFGMRGDRPTHPELLDWLANDFIESGYSLKHLHRQIMLSRTYQLSSNNNISNVRIDPTNRFYWKHSRHALDAESIRDTMLFLSGNLKTNRPGQHPFPSVESWGFTIHMPFHAVYESDHRSVYLMQQRNRRHPFLALFDSADPNISVADRLPTITPTQTLYLMNSPFVQKQAESFASRLLTEFSDDESRLRFAFVASTSRQPNEESLRESIDFLNRYKKRLSETGTSENKIEMVAWTAFAKIILTNNSTLYVD